MSDIWLEDDVFELPEIDTADKNFEDIGDDESESHDSPPLNSLEHRLQTSSPLNSRRSPSVDVKVFNKIVKEIASAIDEVIPNAFLKGIGPAFHECGTFLNYSIDEETKEIKSVWFFFGMGVFFQDQKGTEIPEINDLLIQLWIKKLQIKLHENEIAQHTDVILKKNSYKLMIEHKHTPAKITVLFCAKEALQRSQLIRQYTRFCPNMIQVGYLYNTVIMTNPALHEISNSSLCYLLIHFLQQTDRVEILPSNSFQNPSNTLRNNEQHLKPISQNVNDSVALLCYGFAKFYASFNFSIFIIDISQKELCFWTEADKESIKTAMGIRCSFTGRNLAKQVSSKCIEAFIQKMKEIVAAFEDGNEGTIFPADIEEFAKKPLPPKSKK